jgi:3-phenylpropionate/trans-cinnamate dioxygenase ferredoxin component
MSGGVTWVDVCAEAELGDEDVRQFDHAGGMYAVYRTPSGVYASDNLCTHEYALLSDGLVIGEVIECPLHQGRFHIPTGKAKNPPVCIDLKTYPAREEGGRIQIALPG